MTATGAVLYELIDTQWDVNVRYKWGYDWTDIELIDTQWDVNLGLNATWNAYISN